MSWMNRLCQSIILAVLACSQAIATEQKVLADRKESRPMHEYETRVPYKKGEILIFPDLRLHYLGSRHFEHSGSGPQPRIFQDFKAQDDSKGVGLTWTNDPNMAAPLLFNLGDTEYVLELGTSILSGRALKPNELVLWRAARYRARTCADR